MYASFITDILKGRYGKMLYLLPTYKNSFTFFTALKSGTEQIEQLKLGCHTIKFCQRWSFSTGSDLRLEVWGNICTFRTETFSYLPTHSLSCPFIPYHVLLFLIMSFYSLSCHFIPYHVLLFLIFPLSSFLYPPFTRHRFLFPLFLSFLLLLSSILYNNQCCGAGAGLFSWSRSR